MSFIIPLKTIRQKNFTVTYNMKGCLRFYTFIFLILLNLAKFPYGLSLIEQHHEVEKKNTLPDLV